MTLVLSNDEIAELLPISDCLARLDDVYKEAGNQRAISRPRSDMYGPVHDRGRYVFKTMDGLVPKYEVAAVRLNSDVIRWSSGPAGVRKDKQPVAPGDKWVGLVLLFSTRTGEPLAIMPDGVMQRLRVAAANALAAKYMVQRGPSVYALIGSGWQAGAQALAMAEVFSFADMRIYSPTRENRERLAAELRARLAVPVKAVEDAPAATRDADIVGIATNSINPVVELEWLAPHAHVSCVNERELGEGILEHSSLVVVHSRSDRPYNYIVGAGEQPIRAHDPQEGLPDELKQARASRPAGGVDLSTQPDLGELLTGQVQRPKNGTLTCFVNNIGLGLQFAALGALAYERARQRGLGREMPTDWLLESVHP